MAFWLRPYTKVSWQYIENSRKFHTLHFAMLTTYLTHLRKISRLMKQDKVFPVHDMKACEGSRGMAPLFLDLGDRRVEWSTQSASCFIFGNEFHYHLNGVLDGPHIHSLACCRIWISCRLFGSLVLYRLRYSQSITTVPSNTLWSFF